MNLIKINTDMIYEYCVLNEEAYIRPISKNDRVRRLNIDYLLMWIGKDLDNITHSSIFDLVQKPKFKANENHLVVEPISEEEIIFSDIEKLFNESIYENGMFKLNSNCISPQTTDLLIPLGCQNKIDKIKVNENDLLLYLKKYLIKIKIM